MICVHVVLVVPQLPWLQVAVAEPVKLPAVLLSVPLKPLAFVDCAAEQLVFQVSVCAAQLLSALQLAVAPPPWPVHCHVNGPVPLTAVGVPAAQRPSSARPARRCCSRKPRAPTMICVQVVALVLQVPSLQVRSRR
ncbi:MAG: hypothetical protein U1F43_31445 [Myxococcota bacterium]